MRALVRFGSWLCENARTLGGDRTSYSFKTVLAVKLASALNLENYELQNVILAEFRSFAFLHSQGHKLPRRPRDAISGLPPKADLNGIHSSLEFMPCGGGVRACWHWAATTG
jgi:hypothetical protein